MSADAAGDRLGPGVIFGGGLADLGEEVGQVRVRLFEQHLTAQLGPDRFLEEPNYTPTGTRTP